MNMTKRDRILLSAIALIAVIGGFYWFAIKPAKADLGAQEDQLSQVQSEVNGLNDTLGRMTVNTKGEVKRAAERLRLAKALPDGTEAPGVVVQLQRLADRAGVELTSIKTSSYTDYGSIRGTKFEVRVTGQFFDVDDFLYRLHRQVAVDEKDRPIIGGRLFATTSVDLTLNTGAVESNGQPSNDDMVVGTITVVAFSSVPGGAASGVAPAATPATSVSAPAATTTTTAPATTGTAAAPASTPPVATPSTGGAQ